MNAPAKITRVTGSVRSRGSNLWVTTGRARCQTPGIVWSHDLPRPMSTRRFVVAWLLAFPLACLVLWGLIAATPS